MNLSDLDAYLRIRRLYYFYHSTIYYQVWPSYYFSIKINWYIRHLVKNNILRSMKSFVYCMPESAQVWVALLLLFHAYVIGGKRWKIRVLSSRIDIREITLAKEISN